MAKKVKIDNALLKRLTRAEKKREVGTRSKRVYFLIVTEGVKTEPNYFNALKQDLGLGTISVIDIEGQGKDTLRVVEEAISLRQKSFPFKRYDRIWAVFDRDSFPTRNFNGAIEKAESNNIQCAWSNEAFELWFLLHFHFVNVKMDRADYSDFLNREIRKSIKNFRYEKNSTEIYKILKKVGNQRNAIAWAKQLESQFTDRKFANHNPCTKVHLLIEELFKPEEILAKLELEADDCL